MTIEQFELQIKELLQPYKVGKKKEWFTIIYTSFYARKRIDLTIHTNIVKNPYGLKICSYEYDWDNSFKKVLNELKKLIDEKIRNF